MGAAPCKGGSVCFTGCKFFPGSLLPPPLTTKQLPLTGPTLGTSSTTSPHHHRAPILPAATAGWDLLPQSHQGRRVGAQRMLQRRGGRGSIPPRRHKVSSPKEKDLA